MKKIISFLAALALAFVLPLGALAADNSRSYQFGLTCNGENTVTVSTGDIITVVLTLDRTDGGEAPMYAMQDEIQYDAGFFRYVENSQLLGTGIESTVLGMRDEHHRLYMNYLSLSGGTSWGPSVVVGSFQLEVIAESGVSVITNENYLVSNQDGSDQYQAEAADLSVVISTECTVRFEANGGGEVPDQTVYYGEKLEKPQDPQREGYFFKGWYRDIDLGREWDFDTDTVSGNMVLYAGWSRTELIDASHVPTTEPPQAEGGLWWLWLAIGAVVLAALGLLAFLLLRRRTVTFEANGGTPVEKVRVKKGAKLNEPATPHKDNATFVGWYKQTECTDAWDFKKDVVEKNITLYAKWAEEMAKPGQPVKEAAEDKAAALEPAVIEQPKAEPLETKLSEEASSGQEPSGVESTEKESPKIEPSTAEDENDATE